MANRSTEKPANIQGYSQDKKCKEDSSNSQEIVCQFRERFYYCHLQKRKVEPVSLGKNLVLEGKKPVCDPPGWERVTSDNQNPINSPQQNIETGISHFKPSQRFSFFSFYSIVLIFSLYRIKQVAIFPNVLTPVFSFPILFFFYCFLFGHSFFTDSFLFCFFPKYFFLRLLFYLLLT